MGAKCGKISLCRKEGKKEEKMKFSTSFPRGGNVEKWVDGCGWICGDFAEKAMLGRNSKFPQIASPQGRKMR